MRKIILAVAGLGLAGALLYVPVANACQRWVCTQGFGGGTVCTCTSR